MELNEELAYLAGALRDGTVIIRHGYDYEVRLAQKSYEWLEFIDGIFKRNFGKGGVIYDEKRGASRLYYVLRIFDKKLVEELVELFNIKTPQTMWETPHLIKNASIELVIHYVRGFFDAEGGLPRDPAHAKQYYISFDQANLEALTFIRDKLIQLGYRPTRITKTGGVWQFRLTRRRDIARFRNEIGSWHPEKKKRLDLLYVSLEETPFFSPRFTSYTSSLSVHPAPASP